MKRFALVALVCAMFLASVVPASAGPEISAKVDWQIFGNWTKNMYNFDKDKGNDSFAVWQRARTWFTFAANENLKAVLGTEIGVAAWGSVGAFAIGGDQKLIKIKHAYVDFNVPSTAVNVRAGLQHIALPATFGSSIISEDMTALQVAMPFGDTVSLALGWARLFDLEAGNSVDGTRDADDDWDAFYAVVPVALDGIKLAPFAAFSIVGQDAVVQGYKGSGSPLIGDLMAAGVASKGGMDGDTKIWWAGLNGEVSMLDPLSIMFDINYGNGKIPTVEDQITWQGWYTDLALDFKMDFMTPSVFGTYASGAGSDDLKNDKWGMMPSVRSDSYATTDALFYGSNFANDTDSIMASAINNPHNAAGLGLWQLGVALKQITFLEKLSHDAYFVYGQGTSDKDFATEGVHPNILTKDDKFMSFDFDTKYMLYENLAAIIELNYTKFDMSDDWGKDVMDDPAYKCALGVKYKF